MEGGERLVEVQTFSEPIYNPHGLERTDKKSGAVQCLAEVDETQETPNGCSDAARRRARKAAFDLVGCNHDLNLFITLTLDAARISRTEWGEVIRKLSTWLDNRVRRHGLKYVLVPEHHADGEAIHFHGVINEAAVRLVNSGKKQKGKVVYNLPDWQYGFTTAKRIGGSAADRDAVCKYIMKYLSKETEKIGGRYYLHGGALCVPRYEYAHAEFESVEGFQIQVTDFLSCKIKTLL